MFHYLDQVKVPVFVLERRADNIPRYVFMNAACYDYDGMTPDRFIGKTVLEAFPDKGADAAYARHVACFETARPNNYDVELGAKHFHRRFRTHLVPEVAANGRVRRVIATSIDINAERESSALIENMDSGYSQMEQFVTLAAHDLRAPMRNVKMLTEMLREDFQDHGDGKIALMDLLEDVARKSHELIAEVLEHALTAHLDGRATNFEFGKLCREIRDILDPRGLHDFTWEDAMLATDKMVVQVVLRNLVDNALKHGGASCLNIRLDVAPLDRQNLRFKVSDDGKGFDNPGFAFIESGMVRVDSGYGLLGIRRLITARKGGISTHRGPNGKGTSIVFDLPGTVIPLQNAAETAEGHSASNLRR